MNDSGILDPCPLPEFSLDALCSDSSANNTEQCKNSGLYTFLKVDCYIKLIFYPLTTIFIVIGTVLNLLSLYCLFKMAKRNPQNIYLFVLSLGDTINLHINFAFPMLRQIERVDNLYRSLTLLCRFTGVLTEFFFIFPAWIVVLLTIERLISISYPTKHRLQYRKTRAKIFIIILASIVLILSLYRLRDLKGIDQISVFSIPACNGTDRPVDFMRNINLIIWTLLPECLTFIMSLMMMYRIQSMPKRLKENPSKTLQSQYIQATRAVFRISILFLIFHTPTGITILLDLLYGSGEQTWIIVTILVSRKLTIFLYEISLCCKFFIYYQTFQKFKVILCPSLFHFTRRVNSAKLGRPNLIDAHDQPKHRTFFSLTKQSVTYPTGLTESLTKNGEEHQSMINNHHPRTNSTNLSRITREQQPLTVVMTRNNDAHVSLPRKPDLLRGYSKERKRILMA